MRLCYYGKDGGPESHVWGFWLLEIKWLCSVAVLVFEPGSREAFHSHAFNSMSWLLWGGLGESMVEYPDSTWFYYPSLKPIITRRETFHRVGSVGRSIVLTFRGPWAKTWKEYLPEEKRMVTLTNGRKEVA